MLRIGATQTLLSEEHIIMALPDCFFQVFFDPVLAGETMIAIGTSVPDILSSVFLVSRPQCLFFPVIFNPLNGHVIFSRHTSFAWKPQARLALVDAALSNAVGAQIISILLGVGLPSLVYGAVSGKDMELDASTI